MQQPHLPRLYLGHGAEQGLSRMLDSPAAQYYASPATYGSTPFASGGMLSPPGLDSGRPFAGAHSSESSGWEGAWQGGAPTTLGVGRTTSFSSTGSPLTPVNPSVLSSAFFPQSGMTHSTMHHPSSAPRLPPHPHSHPQQPGPPRKTTLHASTPSFYPGQYSHPPRSTFPRDQRVPNASRRSDSVSFRPGDDPLRSPTLARRASASPATSSVSIKKDEPKKRKIVVRLPRETLTDDEDDSEQRARLSIFARAPLTNDERETVVQRMDADARESVALEADELVGRASHPDEVKMAGLPESIDVYLPGKSAWEEVWDTFEEDMKEKHGHVDLRRPAFLPPSRASTLAFSFDSLLSSRRPGHGRTASLFTSPSQLLPPRLRNALDGVKRASSGHASSLSLSFAGGFDAFRSPLTGSTTAVTSPGAISPLSGSTRLTPFAPAFVPSSTLATAVATPLPTSPAPVKDASSLSSKEAKEGQKSVEAASNDDGGAEVGAEEEEAVGTTSLDVLVSVEGIKGGFVEEDKKQALVLHSMDDSDKRSPPSRRTSGMSTKTDRTGVASDWTGSDIDSLRSPSLSPKQPRPDLSTELSRALEELGPLDSPEQLPALPIAQVSVQSPPDAESDNSQYGDGELSDNEHGEDGDEHGRESGSPRRLRSKLSAGSAGFARPAGSHRKVNSELLFEAPSDVDRPSQNEDSPAEASFHRVKQNFEFPPRSAHSSPRKVSDAAAVALPSSPESARDEYGLPSLPPLGTFGGPVDLSPTDRLDFGTFGQPGSLAVSPITGSSQGWRPSSTLDAAASEFRPSTGRLNAFASDFVPSLDGAAAAPLDPISPSTATYFRPEANETPRRISGSHGPLPPLPLTASKIPSTTSYLDADALGPVSSSMRRVISAPVLVHPQPRRPLPSPPLYMSTPPRYTGYASADDDVELLREPGDERAEESGFGNRSVASIDDPLPEQYAPIRPVLTKEPVPRAVPAIKNGPRLPQETTAGQASPARMGDPRARMESIDVALPTIAREMGRAVPLEQRPQSTGDACSVIEIDDDQTASFTDHDDVPLLFLEKLITDQFDHLRTELTATRSDDKLVELLKSISERLETLPFTTSASGGPSQGLHPSSANRSRDSAVDGSVRPASAPVTRAATPGSDVSPALAYSGFLDDLKATVQPLVGPQLNTSALAGDIASFLAQQLDSTLSSLLSSTLSPKLAVIDDRLSTLVDRIEAEKVSNSAKVVEGVQNALMPLSDLTTLVETTKMHLAGTPATVDLPRIADLESQLAKARNEHGKARSEKAVLLDRLDAEKARHGEEVADLRARLAKCEDDLKASTLKLALRDAAHSVIKDELDRTRRELDTQRTSLSEVAQARVRTEEQLAVTREELSKKEREGAEQMPRLEALSSELAKAHGEIAALEKRVAAQDERLATLQRLKAVQQQSLAAANQRNSDLRKEAAELEQLKETLKEVQAERETARTQETALQERCNTLVEENDRFRRQFDSLQQGLETMKVTVRRELEDADARVAAATAERDRLAADNARLVEQLSALQPLSTPSTPIVAHHPSPQGKASGGQAARLQSQHTGSSAGSDLTIAHTDISPTPSISSQSFTRAEDGWYSSAE
ncbi:hypothetical protein NBRC10512_004601 [Rhodotorula toruloides]|uniref:RHTO0S10e02850g1_1 n=2 Tax=Rhodotorula toruloides TaxID=5286 RepID=A0A061BAI5_RHOTO|nr:uncharacterized protein RHTO_05397 [Rhodotorula toruloides NP11]EMS19025.1 hypothetical protein RHTO_05397 [Rhodotorula toruloides NP11]CDR44901.1 RHTO0S10e02850g1_1 [Rhodotorula toruloides]